MGANSCPPKRASSPANIDLKKYRRERSISADLIQARPTHAPAHEAAHCASIGGHAVIGDMNLHCVGLIALRIESVTRPTRRARRGDVESKPIADLFTGDTAPDPGVESANFPTAAFDQ